MATTADRTDEVRSVGRALALLEELGRSRDALGVTELGRALGVPPATVHRLLATLSAHGYVRQDPSSRRYALGARLVRLAGDAERRYAAWLRPYLEELVELSGETANLAVLQWHHAVYVAQAPSRYSVRMFTEVGRRVLPHCSATGKVLLAHRPRELAHEVIATHGLPRYTEATITDPTRLLAELDAVAEQGYAIDLGEREVGVCCVAVPVFAAGEALGAISVSGPSARLGPAERRRILPEMGRIAASASASFAAGAPGPG